MIDSAGDALCHGLGKVALDVTVLRGLKRYDAAYGRGPKGEIIAELVMSLRWYPILYHYDD